MLKSLAEGKPSLKIYMRISDTRRFQERIYSEGVGRCCLS